MKFVILSSGTIPGFNVRGPVLSPAEYDVHLVLNWLNLRVDVREVMEDGTYRKLRHNDPKLMDLLNKKCDKKMLEKKEEKNARVVDNKQPVGNVRLKPEKKKATKKIDEPKKEQPKVEKTIEEKECEKKVELIIDELEKPE